MDHTGKARKALVFLASLLSLGVVSYLDFITGEELLFFIFYYIPVCLCSWFLSWGSTLAMAMLSGLSWFAVDWLSGHHYPHEGIRYWNSVICFVAFAVIGLVVYVSRRALAGQRRAREEAARALAELARSAEEIRKLQSNLQVVCAWTKRIRVEGQWMEFDRFLADKLHISISHGISPEALEEVRKSLEEQESK